MIEVLTGLVVIYGTTKLGRLNASLTGGPDDPSSAPLVLSRDEPGMAEQQEAPNLYQEEADEQCKTGSTVEEANRLLLPHQVLD